jgi:hypothetical protein
MSHLRIYYFKFQISENVCPNAGSLFASNACTRTRRIYSSSRCSSPRSFRSWQRRQCLAQGTASRRFSRMGSPQ